VSNKIKRRNFKAKAQEKQLVLVPFICFPRRVVKSGCNPLRAKQHPAPYDQKAFFSDKTPHQIQIFPLFLSAEKNKSSRTNSNKKKPRKICVSGVFRFIILRARK